MRGCEKCGKCGKCKFSCIALCLVLLTLYSVCIGIVSFVTAYRFGNNRCNTPLDAHVVVQGVFWFGNAFVFMYLCLRYYLPTEIHFPYPEKAAISRFHGLFAKDVFLTVLLGSVSLGFWWSVLGYYWLSKSTCAKEDAFLITMDSFAVGNEFAMIIIFSLLVYSLICILACDEGSCKFEQFQVDGFLCCCDPCLKKPHDFEERRMKSWQRARQTYPEDRNACLKVVTSTILFFGCVRPSYRFSRMNSVELVDQIQDNPPSPPQMAVSEVSFPDEPVNRSEQINVSTIFVPTDPNAQVPTPREEEHTWKPKSTDDN